MISAYETPAFEKELLKLAHESGNKRLLKLCLNMVNRNKVLTYANSKLLLGVAPPEWGDSAAYKQQVQMLGKQVRKMAREYMRAMNEINEQSNGRYIGYHRQAKIRLSEVENFFINHKLPPVYPKH
jgi:hypothetical protein